jgi:hypothetical protein
MIKLRNIMSKSEIYLINLNTKAAARQAAACLLLRDSIKVQAVAG